MKVKSYYGMKTKAGRTVSNSHELCLELLREQQVGWSVCIHNIRIISAISNIYWDDFPSQLEIFLVTRYDIQDYF